MSQKEKKKDKKRKERKNSCNGDKLFDPKNKKQQQQVKAHIMTCHESLLKNQKLHEDEELMFWSSIKIEVNYDGNHIGSNNQLNLHKKGKEKW